MANDLYWLSALTYAVILVIVLINEIKAKKNPSNDEKAFRYLMVWIVFFCLQDVFWGMCEAHIFSSEKAFFIASSVFHSSAVFTTLFWLYYVIVYTDEKNSKSIIFMTIDGAVVLFEMVLVIINIFKPVLFRIVDGVYVTEYLRPLTFINQYVVFFLSGVITLILSIKTKTSNPKKSERYNTVFLASLAPILLGIFQVLFPDAPFYSLGYFLGCFLIHIFVVVKDREEAEKNNVFKSISDTFYSMHLFDIVTDSVESLIEPAGMTELMGQSPSAQQMLDRVVKGAVTEEYLDVVLKFVDLTTISNRMKNENRLACEFIDKYHGWMRMTLISVDRNDNIQKKVMVITQVIDSEKKYQMDLMFESNNDALTGLYNRRAFENEELNINSKGLSDNLVFASLDVNGLKIVNDSLGHDAGDELLKGAAECMKKCFGPYGKVFRTGGDEFNIIFYSTPEGLEQIKQEFVSALNNWNGSVIKRISLSCGYAGRMEFPNASIRELAKIADEQMYAEKSQFYIRNGIERRGQPDNNEALRNLCSKFTESR